MNAAMGRLGKRDVERLLVAVEAAGDDLDALTDALLGPLATTLDRPVDAGWVALVDQASEVAGWDRARWAALRLAVAPDRLGAAEAQASRDALFDLVAELNECRTLRR